MEILLFAVKIFLYAVMGVSLLAAVGVVLLPNLFHAALALAVVLFSTAAVYVALHAEFIAVVQILIYVGAVMTLVIFAVMMTSRLGDKAIRQHNDLGLFALGSACLLFYMLALVILKTPWPVRQETLRAEVTTAALGKALMGPYLFPFEVMAIFLTAALVGAIIVARKEEK